MSEASAVPDEAPQAVIVEGILDGRVGDAAALQTAADSLGAAGAGAFRCDVQGGRFSLLPVETRVPGASFDAAGQARFLDALHALLRASAPGSVEANLRCRLVYATEVAETLFVVRGERVEPMTRRRPRTPADDAALAPPPAALPMGLRRRDLLVLAPVLLLVGLFVAWRAGWIDRVLAARAETLQVETGPFAAMIAATVERSWGNYEVSLRRGADYPATPEALAALVAKQTDNAHRAACTIVGDGRDLFVQLLDDDKRVLAEVRAEVRPLVTEKDAAVIVKLPGQMNAAGIRLSLNAEPRSK